MKIRNIDFRAKVSVFLLIAAGTLFQSCQQDGVDEWTDGEDELVPIEVQAGITGDVVATRATYEDLPQNSTIGIFCRTLNTYDLVEDVKYTNRSGEWLPVNVNEVIYVGAQPAVLSAYYCLSEVVFEDNGKGAKVVAMKPQPYTEDKDLCYARTPSANVWKENPKAIFEMKHVYSRMTFILIRDLGYVGACKVTNLRLDTNAGRYPFFTLMYLNMGGGSIPGSTRASELAWDMASNGWTDLANNGIPTSGIENCKKIDLLLIPVRLDNTKNLTVQLTVDGQVLSVDIPYDSLPRLEEGIQYCIKLTLKSTSLELGSVETQNWTEVTVGSGDYEIK